MVLFLKHAILLKKIFQGQNFSAPKVLRSLAYLIAVPSESSKNYREYRYIFHRQQVGPVICWAFTVFQTQREPKTCVQIRMSTTQHVPKSVL